MWTWQSVLTYILGNATLLAVFGWVGKSLIEKRLVADSKRLEADLKSKADSTIEQLKSELQRQTLEHQIKFSKLHEKRASVISELYALLSETLRAAESFLSPLQYGDNSHMLNKYKIAMDKSAELYIFFDNHRLYLPESIGTILEQLLSDVRGYVIKLGVYFEIDEHRLQEHTMRDQLEVWNAGWDAIKNQVPKVRRNLEQEFRLLL